jgi:hypothetical protein
VLSTPRRWRGALCAAMAIVVVLGGGVVASAQAQTPVPDKHPYGLDPYKPSDAALLRDYGDTLVAQTPLLDLRALDPYKPSHAALLRDIGGAIPLWGTMWYPAPVPGSLTPFPKQVYASLSATRPRMTQSPASFDEDRATSTPLAMPPPTSMTTLKQPENNDGVWIQFEQQKWISAGRPIPFESSAFERIGQYDGVTVFKRTQINEEEIYLLTRTGLVAPYRLKR